MIGFSDTQLSMLADAVGRIEYGKRNAFMRNVVSEIAKQRVGDSRHIKDAELTRAIGIAEQRFASHLAA